MKTNNEYKNIIEKVFLYSTWSGKLRVMDGIIISTKIKSTLVTFIDNSTKKVINCYAEPEEVYNAMVWLPERNDKKAKEILIKYHETEINELKEKIEGHLTKINIIKEGEL